MSIQCSSCGAIGDLATNDNAWDGWQVVPEIVCPHCIEQELSARDQARSAEPVSNYVVN